MNSLIPRGLEVLVKKAAVDPAFQTALLERRAAVAEEIGLTLEPAEAMMLAATSREQLETVIARTDVPQEHRRAFLGQAAAAMLAAVAAMTVGQAQGGGNLGGGTFGQTIGGASGGMRPGRPNDATKKHSDTVEKRVIAVVSDCFKEIDKKTITRKTTLDKDLQAKDEDREKLRKALNEEFHITLRVSAFKQIKNVGQIISLVAKTLKPTSSPSASGGMRLN